MSDDAKKRYEKDFRKLSKTETKTLVEAMRRGAEERKQDEKDRRCLRGKYAPPTGKCRVCGGRVVGEVTFDYDGRVGGPPRQGYVGRWSCEGCSIVYAKCPQETP